MRNHHVHALVIDDRTLPALHRRETRGFKSQR